MSATDLDALDRQRRRWRRARRPLRLLDPTDDQFAIGGLGSRVEDLTVRLAILPADPCAYRADFDDSFWNTLMTHNGTGASRPFSGATSKCPTSTAAVRFSSSPGRGWREFLALDHAGALDVGCGRVTGFRPERGATGDQGMVGQFFLLPIFDRVRVGCGVFSAFARLLKLSPPYELSLALRGTGGTCLGRFAQGWQEPQHAFPEELSICHEPNILIRREIFSDSDGWPESISESLAVQVENAFESALERFRPRR